MFVIAIVLSCFDSVAKDKAIMLLNDIAQFVDIDIEENAKNGSINLYIGGQEIVKGAEVKAEYMLAGHFPPHCPGQNEEHFEIETTAKGISKRRKQ